MDTATVTGGFRDRFAGGAGNGRALRAAGLVAGIAVAVLADRIGWWWATPALGVAIGVFARGWWVPVWCVVAGLLVWGGDLAVQAARDGTGDGIGRVARVTGGLVGLGPDAGNTVLAVTVGFGVLLCLAGGWLGAAVRSAVLLTRQRPQHAPTTTAPAQETAPVPVAVADTAPVPDAPAEVPALALTSNAKEKLSHG